MQRERGMIELAIYKYLFIFNKAVFEDLDMEEFTLLVFKTSYTESNLPRLLTICILFAANP
jgi:hypothetical protein